MKYRRRLIILLVLVCTQIQLLPLSAVFASSGPDPYMTTPRYDVKIVIEEDASFVVTESIDVDFLERSRGIFRYVPFRGTMYYSYEGESIEQTYRLRISDVQDLKNHRVNVSTENEYKVLRLGSEDVYLLGPEAYELQYSVSGYRDKDENIDQFYWEILPMEWETSVGSGSFEITLPKEFDPQNVEFIAGSYGQTLTDVVSFSVEGNTIYGSLNRSLEYGEGVTLRIVLPDGYFTAPAVGGLWKLLAAILIGLPLLSLVLWFFMGRSPHIVKTVEFYPPEGMNSAEINFHRVNRVVSKDIISLIIYWADKGYLKIVEEQDKTFTLEKIQDLPKGTYAYEQGVFSGLFRKGKLITQDTFSKSFYPYLNANMNALQAMLRSTQPVYSTLSKVAASFTGLFMYAPMLCFVLITYYVQIMDGAYLGVGVVGAILPPVFIKSAFSKTPDSYGRKKSHLFAAILSMLITLGISAVIIVLFVALADEADAVEWAAASVASFVVCFFFHRISKARTKENAKLLGKILGFRDFIQKAELDRLEKLVEEDPSYFYHILPYAYALDLTDKWVKRFENISIPEPDWYRGYYPNQGMFTAYVFANSFNRCTRSMQRTVDKAAQAARAASARSSSSGGSSGGGYSGGGGFSGGGMGGGGGGRW